MAKRITIDQVEIHLSMPDDLSLEWVGRPELLAELHAAWMIVDKADLPMTPRLVGKPGVGKTTLAYGAAKKLGRPAYIFQARRRTASCANMLGPWRAETTGRTST